MYNCVVLHKSNWDNWWNLYNKTRGTCNPKWIISPRAHGNNCQSFYPLPRGHNSWTTDVRLHRNNTWFAHNRAGYHHGSSATRRRNVIHSGDGHYTRGGKHDILSSVSSQIEKFVGPTWGPSGATRTQVGPMLAPWTLLSGMCHIETVLPSMRISIIEIRRSWGRFIFIMEIATLVIRYLYVKTVPDIQ